MVGLDFGFDVDFVEEIRRQREAREALERLFNYYIQEARTLYLRK